MGAKIQFVSILQGFTYVAPSILEEMYRPPAPRISRARSPRKSSYCSSMSELAAEAQFLSPGFRTPFNMPKFTNNGVVPDMDDMNMEITTAFENNCNVGTDEDHHL